MSKGIWRQLLDTQPILVFIIAVTTASIFIGVTTALIFRDFGRPAPLGPDVSKLQRVLEERLPTSDVLKSRHRELIDALRSSPPNSSIKRADRLTSTAGYVLLGGGLLVSLGSLLALVWLVTGGGQLTGGQKAVVGTMFGVGTLFGGVTLLKNLDLHVTVQSGDSHAAFASQAVTMSQHGSIGPFATGSATLEPSEVFIIE